MEVMGHVLSRKATSENINSVPEMTVAETVDPEEFIRTVRDSHHAIEQIYMEGGCAEFSLMLSKIWPNAIPYHSSSEAHVYTYIRTSAGAGFYDIRGRHDLDPDTLTLVCLKDTLEADVLRNKSF